ncbi:MAG TPA: hypothetical protein PKV43_04850 [Armatimonadota bacterium]|nr:hypothetical protein [Armatimonadota bacterium]
MAALDDPSADVLSLDIFWLAVGLIFVKPLDGNSSVSKVFVDFLE